MPGIRLRDRGIKRLPRLTPGSLTSTAPEQLIYVQRTRLRVMAPNILTLDGQRQKGIWKRTGLRLSIMTVQPAGRTLPGAARLWLSFLCWGGKPTSHADPALPGPLKTVVGDTPKIHFSALAPRFQGRLQQGLSWDSQAVPCGASGRSSSPRWETGIAK